MAPVYGGDLGGDLGGFTSNRLPCCHVSSGLLACACFASRIQYDGMALHRRLSLCLTALHWTVASLCRTIVTTELGRVSL